MDNELLTRLVIGLLVAVAACSLAFSCRHAFAARLDRDISWCDELRQRMDPQAPSSRKLVICVYVVLGCVLLPLFLFLSPIPLLGLAFWMCLLLIPQQFADWHWERHLRAIDAQLPACIGKFASLCSAGLSSADALQQLAAEAPLPIRHEFRVMANEWRMGADLVGVFRLAYLRLGLESMRLLAAAVNANAELGGNLVQTLEQLSVSLYAQWETRKEIGAAMAEGKMNIYGLVAAPPLMLGIICLCDMEAVRLFFSTSMGIGIFVIAMIIIAIGVAWAWSIAKIRV